MCSFRRLLREILGKIKSVFCAFPPILAEFFQDSLSEMDLDEMNAEILRNKLYKVWNRNKPELDGAGWNHFIRV